MVTSDANGDFTSNGSNCWGHNQDPAGGRVRFSTNSRYVVVNGKMLCADAEGH